MPRKARSKKDDSGGLFVQEDGEPMRFFMSPDEDGHRATVRALVVRLGGEFLSSTDPRPDDVIELVTPKQEATIASSGKRPPLVYSQRFVEECAKENRLLDLDDFKLKQVKQASVAPDSPYVAKKRKRGPTWTEEEDTLLGVRMAEASKALGGDATYEDMFRWIAMYNPMEERSIDSMHNRFKNKANKATRPAFDKAMGTHGRRRSAAAAAAVGEGNENAAAGDSAEWLDDDDLDDFDRELLTEAAEADPAESANLLADSSNKSSSEETPSKSASKKKKRAAAAASPRAAKGAKTSGSGDAAAASAKPAVVKSDDGDLASEKIQWLAETTGSSLREAIFAVYRHSGWLGRAVASLTDPIAPQGCDPADDPLLNDDETGCDEHVAKYGDELSSERLMFKEM